MNHILCAENPECCSRKGGRPKSPLTRTRTDRSILRSRFLPPHYCTHYAPTNQPLTPPQPKTNKKFNHTTFFSEPMPAEPSVAFF